MNILRLKSSQGQGLTGLAGKKGMVQDVESVTHQVEIDLIHVLIVVEDFSEEREELFVVESVRRCPEHLNH